MNKKLLLSALCIPIVFGSAHAAGFDKSTVEPAERNMRQGQNRMKEGDYEGASDNFLQAIYFSRNHYNPQAYLGLGLCYKAMRQYPKAVEALTNHLSQITEPDPNARIDLAEVYISMNDFDKAEKELDKARAESAGLPPRCMFAMGELLEKMGKPGEAIGQYEEATNVSSNYGVAWMGKARCNVKMERYMEALTEYREILDRGPLMGKVDYAELYYYMGTCYYKRGDHQGAIDRWLEALKQNPDYFEAHVSLASVFDEEKHISSAIHQYQLCLRTAPKGYNLDQITKRLQYLESKMKPKEVVPVEIKPSPAMRQEAQDQEIKANPPALKNAKDSGF